MNKRERSNAKIEMTFLWYLVQKFLPRYDGYTNQWRQSGKWTWYACSHQEWARACLLTRKQLRIVEQRCEKMGLVDTMLWRFNNVPTKHYHMGDLRAVRIRLALLLSKLLEKGQSEKGQSIMSLYIKPDKRLLDYIGITYLEQAQQKAAAQSPMSHMSEMKTMGKITGTTAQEVLNNLNKSKTEIPPPTKISSKPMGDYWQRLLPMYVDKGFHKPLTMKELGQITLFIKSAGVVHAAPAMEWAVREWAKMRYRAEEELGEGLPTSPTISGLLRGCSVAVNGYLSEKQQVQVAPPKVKSVVVQITAPKGTKATSADIAKALQELDHD